MPIVTTQSGVRLFAKDWDGRPDNSGHTVVLIHGWPLNSDMWDFQAFQMASSGMRVIAYDRRGFGRSDQPWTGYDYDTLADDLGEVLQQLNATDVTLVGFSMGGGEVARYMSRHAGKRIDKCVLIGSVTPFLLQTDDNQNGADGEVFDGMQKGILADRADFFQQFFPNFYSQGQISNRVSNASMEWTRTMAMQASLKATLDCVTSFGTTDFRSDLPSINVPTMVVHGDTDLAVPLEISGQLAARAIAGAELCVFKDAPHGLHLTHAQELADTLIRFVNAN